MKKIIVTILLLISHINVYSVGTGNLSQAKQEEANDQLLNAAAGGSIQLVNSALQSGANVNAAINDGNTALMMAAMRGHAEIVKLLLDAPGIDVNVASKYGYTALMQAAGQGHAEVVKLLLANGADVNKRGHTALMLAAWTGHAEVVKLLLANGANVNAANNNGYTALMQAAVFGQTEIVKLLLANGANVNAANKYGDTALMSAAVFGHAEIVKLLLANGANVNAANNHGNTALMMAEEKGHTQIAELLLISSPEKMKDSLEQLKEIQPQTKYFSDGLNALIQVLVKPEEESWSMCKKVGGVMLCGAALAAALKYGVSQS